MKSFFKKIIVSILIFEAKIILKRHQPNIIAITGSVGKTTTKDTIYAAIKGSIRARKSEKSFNSELGVPLTILGLHNAWNNPFLWFKNILDGMLVALFSRDYPEVLVLETGIDRPGDMKKMTEWLKPDIAVLTRLPAVPVHVEYFSTPEEVVKEKMRLISATKPGGVMIYNNDDTIIQKQLPDIFQKTVGYGRYLNTTWQGKDDRIVYEDNVPVAAEYQVHHQGQQYTVRNRETLGTQHVYAGAAALAVAYELGLDIKKAADSLSQLPAPKGRMRLIPGIKSTLIIDDTYNSSPTAVEHALQTLNEIRFAKRKIVVLGDMLELGRFSTEEHIKLGKRIPPIARLLLTVGIRARRFSEGALDAGMPEQNILQYDNVSHAGKELQNILEPGDVVLIKASQGIRAEKIVEEIMANPDDAHKILVRQDQAWQER